jgi:CRP-like cAMP-binding protein
MFQQTSEAGLKMRLSRRIEWNAPEAPWRTGQFFKQLSCAAMREFESISVPISRAETTALFTQGQKPSSVFFLLEGNVKLSLNSSNGGRIIVGIAGSGEALGMTSAISGLPCEMTAETQFPCTVSFFPRQKFLNFLNRHPTAFLCVASQLSLDHRRTCERLQLLGLTLSAPRKLARLLIEWCEDGELNRSDSRLRCTLTHEEIGEHIGASRETVTRALSDLKQQGLVNQHGSILIVPNRGFLATFAGIG